MDNPTQIMHSSEYSCSNYQMISYATLILSFEGDKRNLYANRYQFTRK
jgi:hypothetical protein